MLAQALRRIRLATAALLAFAWTAPAGIAAERPNVLIIVSDDQGWNDIGYHGSEIRTPNLDRLATESIRLEQHYVFPMCSPTRTALMSGRNPSRYGVLGATNSQVFPLGTVTLAGALGSLGYETAITGKWHLGSKPEWGPRKYGFDFSYGILAGGIDQYTHRYKAGPYRRTWHRNEQYVDEEGHSTDLFAAEAIRFIEKERRGPFFLYLPFTAVHIPLQEPDRWLGLYDGVIDEPSRKAFAAAATHMDDAIGRVLAAVDRTGQRERTLVIFFSDNGGQKSWTSTEQYEGNYPPCPVLGDNRPLRGWKGEVYEGAIRVPALVHWQGTLAPGKLDAVLSAMDWFPTLAALTGYQPEQDLRWDGKDVWPLLTGQPEVGPRTLYWNRGGLVALRHGDWKLVGRRGQEWKYELYDLASDPHETQDVAGRFPDRLAELKERLAEQQRLDPR
ncbi:MAG TPA: sulfatase-like hydrolase/transferase [Thermoguttaceae bacterium]|nr:sulfatase-like hydrolase/transferase [Thermoguttaceae bacterium]